MAYGLLPEDIALRFAIQHILVWHRDHRLRQNLHHSHDLDLRLGCQALANARSPAVQVRHNPQQIHNARRRILVDLDCSELDEQGIEPRPDSRGLLYSVFLVLAFLRTSISHIAIVVCCLLSVGLLLLLLLWWAPKRATDFAGKGGG